MDNHNLLAIIVATLGISVIINLIFKKFAIPQIIGYILTGTIITNLFNLKVTDGLVHIAEFGIVFLMFMIGVELSIDKMKSIKKEVFVFGGLQVILTGFLFFTISKYVFDLELKKALIIGFAFALSSTAIVLKTLNENRDIQKPYGINSLGILIFQDISAIPILLMVTILTSSSNDLSSILLDTSISAIIVFFILFVAGKPIMAYFLKFASESKLHEIFIGAILFIVMGSAYLAHYFGFSYSLGAFISGMVIAETQYKHQVQADLEHFRDILLGVFFVSVGMQIDISFAIENIVSILEILVAIFIAKAIIIFLIVRAFSNKKTSFKSAIALSQVGEFSFAIFELSRANGLINDTLNQELILVVVFSMILTPFILKNIDKITNLFIRKIFKETPVVNKNSLNNHIIVCGYGLAGQKIAENLRDIRANYVVIDKNIKAVDNGIKKGENIIYGDVSKKHILKEAHINKAISIIVVINNVEQLRVICDNILELTVKANIVVSIIDQKELNEVYDLKNKIKIIDYRLVVGKEIIESAMICKI